MNPNPGSPSEPEVEEEDEEEEKPRRRGRGPPPTFGPFGPQEFGTIFRIPGDPCPTESPWHDGRRCGACGGYGAMWSSHERPWSNCAYCQPRDHRERCDVWRCADQAVWFETRYTGEYDLCERHGRHGMARPPAQRVLEVFA